MKLMEVVEVYSVKEMNSILRKNMWFSFLSFLMTGEIMQSFKSAWTYLALLQNKSKCKSIEFYAFF